MIRLILTVLVLLAAALKHVRSEPQASQAPCLLQQQQLTSMPEVSEDEQRGVDGKARCEKE